MARTGRLGAAASRLGNLALGVYGGGESVEASAELATGSGAALDASTHIAPNVEAGLGTGTALDATVSTGTGASANAELAAGTGAALDPTPALAPSSGLSSGTGAALATRPAVSVNAGLASGTGAANAATVAIRKSVPAGLASGTGVARNVARIWVRPRAGLAAGVGSAGAATARYEDDYDAAVEPDVPMAVLVQITVGGVDVTNDVDYRRSRFTTTSNGQAGTAEIWVRDLDREWAFVTGSEIIVRFRGIRMWGGYLANVRRQYVFASGTGLSEEPRYLLLDGVDYNVLFNKRVYFDPGDTDDMFVKRWPNGTRDEVVINELVNDYLTLDDDGLTFDIQHVGTPALSQTSCNPDAPDVFGIGSAGWLWGEVMNAVVSQTGAVYCIDPDKVFRHVDDSDKQSRFGWGGVSDAPDNVNTLGYRDVEFVHDGARLTNDHLQWGAGQGSASLGFTRVTDSTSLATHGRWQTGELRYDMYCAESIEERAETWVYGSPQNRRGGKDDRISARFTVHEPYFRVADVITVESTEYDLSYTLPIRHAEITFPTPYDIKCVLTAAHELDAPWQTFEFWIPTFDFNVRPPGGFELNPPVFNPPELNPPVIVFPPIDQCEEVVTGPGACEETFTRNEANGLGTAEAPLGLSWLPGSNDNFAVNGNAAIFELGSDSQRYVSLDSPGITGPLDIRFLVRWERDVGATAGVGGWGSVNLTLDTPGGAGDPPIERPVIQLRFHHNDGVTFGVADGMQIHLEGHNGTTTQSITSLGSVAGQALEDTYVRFRYEPQVGATNARVRMKSWDANAAEPDWQSSSLTTSTFWNPMPATWPRWNLGLTAPGTLREMRPGVRMIMWEYTILEPCEAATAYMGELLGLPGFPSEVCTDNFDREVSDGWGTSEWGVIWQDYFPTAGSPAVSSGIGEIVGGPNRMLTLGLAPGLPAEILVKFRFAATSSNAYCEFGIGDPETSGDLNTLAFDDTGANHRLILNHHNTQAFFNLPVGWTVDTAEWWWCRYRMLSTTQSAGSMWPDSEPEPEDWQVQVTGPLLGPEYEITVYNGSFGRLDVESITITEGVCPSNCVDGSGTAESVETFSRTGSELGISEWNGSNWAITGTAFPTDGTKAITSAAGTGTASQTMLLNIEDAVTGLPLAPENERFLAFPINTSYKVRLSTATDEFWIFLAAYTGTGYLDPYIDVRLSVSSGDLEIFAEVQDFSTNENDTVTSLTGVVANEFWVRVLSGSGGGVKVRTWFDGDPEPSTWDLETAGAVDLSADYSVLNEISLNAFDLTVGGFITLDEWSWDFEGGCVDCAGLPGGLTEQPMGGSATGEEVGDTGEASEDGVIFHVDHQYQRGSTEVWVNGLRIRLGEDYIEYPRSKRIEILDHIDVTDASIRVNYVIWTVEAPAPTLEPE